MATPRFSLRELLMLMAIVALSIPYLYIRAPKENRIDLSYGVVRALVNNVDSDATIESGGGGSAIAEFTCLVPIAKSDDFFRNLRKVVKEHIQKSKIDPREKWSTETSFSYELTDTSTSHEVMGSSGRCLVVGELLERKKGRVWAHDKEVDVIRFSIHTFKIR